jgi:hypothetical protein
MPNLAQLTKKSIDILQHVVVWYQWRAQVNMEQYIINGQVITNLTTTTESNALIMRKGRTSLLSAKVMLFALLKVENRNIRQYSIEETRYYEKLKKNSNVDYTRGIVSEIDVADLKKILKRENSGSFYTSLRELFSIDPHEEKSLRNSWAVMLPNSESDTLGYAEVITACHYDTSTGKLFLKFSDEDYVKEQILQLRENFTELPFLHMLEIKSIYTYRLYEILYAEVTKVDVKFKEDGGAFPLPSEYSFRFSLGELQLMLGAIDVTADRIGKKQISAKNPDYNAIAEDVNSRQCENMGAYRAFRKYSLDVATNEINSTESSAFTISYDVEKEEGSRKVSHVIFYVKKKTFGDGTEPPEHIERQKGHDDFIVELARELCDMALNFEELGRIAKTSDYDIDLIRAARVMYDKFQLSDNFADWFVEFRR